MHILLAASLLVALAACGVTQSGERITPPQTPASGAPTAEQAQPMAHATEQLPLPLPEPPGQIPTPAPGAPGTLALVGFYDPQDQAAAAVEFRRRVARFEHETDIKVAYEWKPRTDVNLAVRTYLAAGSALDLGPVLPEDIDGLIKVGILTRLDRLAGNQRWPGQTSQDDQICIVEGWRYCVVDEQGMAWIVPKNTTNPLGAVRMLELLFTEG
jgi:ABC-type glycerol-3-phosphate transport system substrate-binding protein